jgi:dUTP pyrophosphatase
MTETLKLRRTGAVEVPLPAYQTLGSAGLDLCAALGEAVQIQPGERRLIPTGLIFEIPPGFEGQVRPRSGLALKFGISIVNSPGTIDSDFRGEVGVVLINHGQEPYVVEPLSRIAQIVIARVEQVEIVEADALTETSRGAGGYGSTGHR